MRLENQIRYRYSRNELGLLCSIVRSVVVVAVGEREREMEGRKKERERNRENLKRTKIEAVPQVVIVGIRRHVVSCVDLRKVSFLIGTSIIIGDMTRHIVITWGDHVRD